MEAESEKVYLQNIEDYVLDENKIVTCKWLSKNLSLHINVARKLLKKFISEQKQKHPGVQFEKTFFLSGVLKDEARQICTIVNEVELATVKETLKSIFSEHIYSISKGSQKIDSNSIFLAEDQGDCVIGTVKNDSFVKRGLDELSALRVRAYPKGMNGSVKPETKKSNSMPINTTNKECAIKNEDDNKVVQNVQQKSNAASNSTKLGTKKSTGIAGFFSKQIANSKPKIENVPVVSKPAEKEKVTPKRVIKEESADRNINGNANGIERSSPNKKIKMEVESPVKNSKSNNPVKENSSSKNRKKSSQNKREPAKKRKRIQTLESDSEGENSEEEIFAPESPERPKSPMSSDEDVIPATPEVKDTNKAQLNSKKRKRTVDKTYIDEKGYIITKKEEVYESCSDNEEEVTKAEEKPQINNKVKSEVKPVPSSRKQSSPTKPEAKPVPSSRKQSSPTKGKKKSPPQGQGKQQNLMNFFKKTTK